MKKLVTLLLAAGLVLSAAGNASAVEIKASGYMDFTFEYYQNMRYAFEDNSDSRHNLAPLSGLLGEDLSVHQKHSGAVERLRFGVDFIMSESLSAYYEAQVGIFTWGGPGAGAPRAEWNGGSLGDRAANLVTRYAYLDWMVPNTEVKVRMGQQPVALPSYTFGSPILDDSATGIVVSAPITENIGVTALWVRALSDNRRTDNFMDPTDDNFDVLGLVGDFSYDGFSLSPWTAVGFMGDDGQNPWGGMVPVWGYNVQNADGTWDVRPSTSTAWFIGIGGDLTMFDPFRFTADFYYSATYNDHSATERSGWFVALGAEYKTAYGTPALKGWYASGDDSKDSNGSERPLSLSGAFNPTTTYFDGVYSIANTIDNTSAEGSWGVSLQWNGLSFVKDLTHDASVTYIRGTNSAAVPRNWTANNVHPSYYLTKGDALVEIDFNTTYMIYTNLATVLELSYLIEDFSGKTWGQAYGLPDGQKAQFSNAWRAALNFRYSF